MLARPRPRDRIRQVSYVLASSLQWSWSMCGRGRVVNALERRCPRHHGGASALAAALVISLSSACTWEHTVPVFLEVDEESPPDVRAYMLVVFEMDACPNPSDFTLDDHQPSQVSVQFFRQTRGEAVGVLEPGQYTFVGAGLLEDCRAVVAGCARERLRDDNFSFFEEDDIRIPLEPVETSSSICGVGQRCDDGECEELP